jgi:hypothetical protein
VRELDRFVDNVLSAVAAIPYPFAVGTIDTVDTGTTPATVTVTWNGGTYPAKFPRGLSSPTVGHKALMVKNGQGEASELLIVHTY